ncbi:hypothetical protein [Methanococcoides sp. NM1]|uniref:hypothetical protein n=1 Tax=Methanococcoides sp. NM1 TaxID=1201013 RepID=UPI001083896E|nr:hypothetical protein [Methanococcoides sp. NM1]
MSKILKAVDAMFNSEELITDVKTLQDTLFFKYNQTYVWSIQKELGDFYLIYYVNHDEVKNVIDAIKYMPNDPGPYISYSSKDYKSTENGDNFAELYQIVKEKLYNIDTVLDNIISGE